MSTSKEFENTYNTKKPKSFIEYKYHAGFGNSFVSEALKGACPKINRCPQKCPYGLYAEQLNGTSFTAPRGANSKLWMYRIMPAAKMSTKFKQTVESKFLEANFLSGPTTPDLLRWKPAKIPDAKDSKVDFLQGFNTVSGSGSAQIKTGLAIHIYAANTDMVKKMCYNTDGEMLIVPQQGVLNICTELGWMCVAPGEICVIPRGIGFRVCLPDGQSRGYVCEVFQGRFVLPPLGIIGANGCAVPEHFETPTAWYEDKDEKWECVYKFMGETFTTEIDHSPFNVVGWMGNYVPYKYDLAKFNVLNTVSYAHIDPSIFCVLTCQTLDFGTAVCDFVIFPRRWSVQEDTFRPPYYHKNTMSEFMGNVFGMYEAKSQDKGNDDGDDKGAFLPGGASLHSCMIGHGPEAACFEKESNKKLDPEIVADGSLSFMFESVFMLRPTKWGLKDSNRDTDYFKIYQPLKKYFNPNEINPWK